MFKKHNESGKRILSKHQLSGKRTNRKRCNIRNHSLQEKRCRCTEYGKTFALSKGTPFYRLHIDPQIVMQVITLLTRQNWQLTTKV